LTGVALPGGQQGFKVHEEASAFVAAPALGQPARLLVSETAPAIS
jgi:hypothetical protein